MAIEIMIPRLGWSMDEGVFVGWLKSDGDPVRAGDSLFALQGEKATQDVEAIDDGILRIPSTAPTVGATVVVGAIIGYLLQPGESDPSDKQPATITELVHAIPAIHHPVLKTISADEPRSSPLARRIAREHGIDWTKLVGSGSSGRIRRADVLDAIRIKEAPTQPSTTNQLAAGSIPASQARRITAARMLASHRSTAPVTLTTSVDMTNLVGLRQQYKAVGSNLIVPSFLDFFVKLTSLALKHHPLLNARWLDGADQIDVPEVAHIGIAVDTDAGLFVPVIQSPAQLGLTEIAKISRELIDRARNRKLRPNDLQGGTFTITNLGAFGIETFTPIINSPECAILGMGRISRKPVMDGDKVVGRDLMNLSLTFDHRIVDGAPAARFLEHLTRCLENPAPWLMS